MEAFISTSAKHALWTGSQHHDHNQKSEYHAVRGRICKAVLLRQPNQQGAQSRTDDAAHTPDNHHYQRRQQIAEDRKSTRLNPVTNAHLVCRLLLEKKNTTIKFVYDVKHSGNAGTACTLN